VSEYDVAVSEYDVAVSEYDVAVSEYDVAVNEVFENVVDDMSALSRPHLSPFGPWQQP
jgi:hypothetical protein